MKESKAIQKLTKKAELIDKFEISEDKVTDVGIEGFYNSEGKIYLIEKEGIFYMDQGNSWLRFRLDKAKEETIEEISEEIKEKNPLDERILKIEAWAGDMKSYVDKELKILGEEIVASQKDQVEFFKEISDNLDLKIKKAMEEKEVKNEEKK